MTFQFDPASAAFLADPYPTYRALRDEAHVHHLPDEGLWFVSRHADVGTVLQDHERFSSARGNVVVDAPVRIGATLGSMDPPQHDVLRRTVMRGFTPQRLDAAIPSLREDARERLAAFASRREWDFVNDFSRPVLFAALGRMLGLDAQAARTASELMGDVFDGQDGPLGRVMPNERMAAIFGFLREELDRRKARRGDDLFSVLIEERDKGAHLTDAQIVGNMSTVLLAGNASIGHYVPNLIAALCAFPDERRRLLSDLSLIDAAVEEGVRYDTSTQAFARQTTAPVELSGVGIGADQRVVVLLGSANRDERAIADPDVFAIGRGKVKHFGFGAGPHVCMGAPTARRFSRALLEELLPAIGEFELDLAGAERSPHVMVRGFRRLPMRW